MSNAKTVGVITFFDSSNYGQLLQVYSTSAVVKSMGYDCEVINRSSGNIPKEPLFITLVKYALRVCSGGFSVLRKTLASGKVKKEYASFNTKYTTELSVQKNMFDIFRDNKLKVGKTVYTNTKSISANPPVYDAYICGSDQIWNPNAIFAQSKHEYFLTFAPQGKRVAYAPSFSVEKLPRNCIPSYKKWVSQIPYLSCREIAGVQIIKELTGLDAMHVLDPSLLLEQTAWDELIGDAKVVIPDEPYILCYILGIKTEYESFVDSVVQAKGYRVITLPTITDGERFKHTNLFEAGPAEFVALIKHAAFIVTDSFHGVAISMLYNKPFRVFQRDDGMPEKANMFSRIDSLLTMCKIDMQVANAATVFSEDMLKIDFGGANTILKDKRLSSLQFLSSSLEKACEG